MNKACARIFGLGTILLFFIGLSVLLGEFYILGWLWMPLILLFLVGSLVYLCVALEKEVQEGPV